MQKDTFTCKTHRTDAFAKAIQGPSQPVLGVSLPADQRRLLGVSNTSQVFTPSNKFFEGTTEWIWDDCFFFNATF